MIFFYKPFVAELNRAFSTMAHLVTEDWIRQCFIDAQSLVKKEVRIEKPYRNLRIKPKFCGVLNNQARADLYYQEHGDEDTVIEFKYHKKLSTSTTCKTTNMGEVFRDFNRLSVLDNKEKYLIYVFDEEMKNYYDSNVFDILKIAKAKGKTLDNRGIPSLTKGKKIKDFENSAFFLFDRKRMSNFLKFEYTVEVLYSDCIATYKTLEEKNDSIYMLVMQVK